MHSAPVGKMRQGQPMAPEDRAGFSRAPRICVVERLAAFESAVQPHWGKLWPSRSKTPSNPTDKKVALIIAILALFLALAEAGAKNAEHRSTEQNIESSDLFNFYQAKKVRSTIAETAAQAFEVERAAASDPKAQEAFDKQIADWKATVAKFEKDPKNAGGQPGRDSGARQGGGRGTRIVEPQARTFRIRQRGAANRDRPRFGGDHHRHDHSGLARRRSRRDRRGSDGVRLSRADGAEFPRLSRRRARRAKSRQCRARTVISPRRRCDVDPSLCDDSRHPRSCHALDRPLAIHPRRRRDLFGRRIGRRDRSRLRRSTR